MFVKIASSEIPYYQFPMLEPYSGVMKHAIFTRAGGISEAPFTSLNVRYGIGDPDASVTKNRQIMQLFFEHEFLDNSSRTLISANQTHSDHIAVLAKGEALPEVNEIDDIDAFVTDRNDILLLVQVADCQPIILLDPITKTLGMVHNGWRGCIQDVIGKTVSVMCDEFGVDAKNIIACIGPSIGPCCHYFTDPANELPSEFHKYIFDEKQVDFWAAAKDQLMEAGIPAGQIEISNICTSDHTNEFYSYRRENRLTGRFGVVAGLL